MNQLNKDIDNNTFQQFYLLMGDEGYLKKQYKEKLVNALVDIKDTMNYYYAEGNNLNLSDVYETGETLPFFTDYRVIVLENTGLLKKTAEGVSEHFEKFPKSTVVIMVEQEVDGRNSFYKWYQKNGYVAKLNIPDEKMLISWVKKLCQTEGKVMDDTAIYYMIEHMGTDMFLLKNELEKAFAYCSEKSTITLQDIHTVCIDEAEDKMFDMLDAIGNRNQKKALQLYRDLLQLRKPAMQILSLLSRHYNILMQISQLKSKNKDNKEIASICGIPPFTIKKYINQASGYSFTTLYQMVEQCTITEQEVKTGILKDVVGVELLIVEFSK